MTPEFKQLLSVAPQKALHLYKDEELKKPNHIGKEYAVMEKYDGWFMYIDCIDGNWQGCRSKEGRVLPSMKNINRKFNEGLKPTKNMRIIFEAIIPGMVFKDLNGRFNQQRVALDNVVLMAHDILIEGSENLPFKLRYTQLGQVVKRLGIPELKLVQILQSSASKDVWMKYYKEVISKPNGEGIILKDINAKYQAGKRTAGILKIKCEVTQDLLVIDVEKGKLGSKYETTLGRLVVRNRAGIVNKVSGMSDEQRDAWIKDPSLIVGHVVEVQAMKILSNGSLREGRFKAERFDKSENDID